MKEVHATKLMVAQQDMKFSSFYSIRRFITAFTKDTPLSLSCARNIQSQLSLLLHYHPLNCYPSTIA